MSGAIPVAPDGRPPAGGNVKPMRGVAMTPIANAASTLLFGIAANADNLTLGFAYGLKGRRIGWLANLLIAIITTAITLVALIFGRAISALLPVGLPTVVGGSLLVALAAWSLFRDRNRQLEHSAVARTDGRGSIGLTETLYLSGALSINNIGLAVAGGIGGIDPAPAAISIFFFSVVMLVLGQALSAKLAQVRCIGRLLHSPLGGDVVLLMAGVAMLVGAH